jgi:hypothetical protein
MMWQPQMTLYTLKLKKSNFEWISLIVMIDTIHPRIVKPINSYDTINMNYADRKYDDIFSRKFMYLDLKSFFRV